MTRLRPSERHLARVDPVMKALIARHGPCTLRRRRRDPFASLVASVVAQRVSVGAARTVQRRLQRALGGPATPARVLATAPETLRGAGLPARKVEAIRELAARATRGDLALASLDRGAPERVEAALVEVPGVGPWTAHMFLIFHVAHPDVFPAGDLGVQEGLRRAYGLEVRPTPAEARRHAEPWAPFRSTAAWYLWRVLGGPDEG